MSRTVLALILIGCAPTDYETDATGATGTTGHTGDELAPSAEGDSPPGTILIGVPPTDADGDGFDTVSDCDDNWAVINPSATEICDGVDNDCDGDIDEGGVCPCDTTELPGYAFCDTPETWSAAQNSCHSMGYELVTINDAGEDAAVVAAGDALRANQSRWIGYNDIAVEGSFEWASGETPSYTNWGSGEPNNSGNEDCTQNNWGGSDEWNDARCSRTNRYVCETCTTQGWYADVDGDGYGDDSDVTFACVQPADTVAVGGDCDDGDLAINPDALETCDGVDNDCNGMTDEGVATWFLDADGDTYGDPTMSVTTGSCPGSPPLGYVADARDCDDAVAATNPDGVEQCDGVDNDCDADVDEAPGECAGACTAYTFGGSQYLLCDTPTTYLDALAQCESYGAYTLATFSSDAENDAVTAAADALDGGWWYIGINDRASEGNFVWESGEAVTYTNWGGGEPNNSGGNEDCGHTNFGGSYEWNDVPCTRNEPFICETCIPEPYFADDDNDGFGDPSDAVYSCSPVDGRVTDATDCDDDAIGVNPAAGETCNGIDDDCDGATDETAEWYRDADGDGFGDPNDSTTTADCSTTPPGYVADQTDCDDSVALTNPNGTEICNGFDDDCDNEVDEDDVCAGTGCISTDFDGSNYLLCNDDLSFDAARTACQDVGYELFVIDSAAEETAIGAIADAENGGAWWIGYTDADSEGTFVWVDGTPTSYTNWNGSEPNNAGGGEDCATFNVNASYAWNDLPCTRTEPYVCEECSPEAWFEDVDGDGFGDPASVEYACTRPDGYTADNTDCDDTEATTFPGADEACDGADNDCDGDTDEDTVWFADDDSDTFGDPADTIPATCSGSPPPGYVTNAADCDDTTSAVSPTAAEVCDALDNDCDSDVDEDGVCTDCETFTDAGSNYLFCTTPDGFDDARNFCLSSGYDLVSVGSSAENSFVQSTAASLSTASWWIGYTDEATEGTWVWVDGTPFGYENWNGSEPNNSGGNEDCAELYATSGAWNDTRCTNNRRFVCEIGCSTTRYYEDIDGDGFGDPAMPIDACMQPADAVLDNTDCDDTDGAINPSVTDMPGNAVDEDCDGVDDCYDDGDGDGFGSGAVVPGNDMDCTDAGESSVLTDCNDMDPLVSPAGIEVPVDGIDQDCDGVEDCYTDEDGDGVGTLAVISGDDMDCTNSLGESDRSDDCDDDDTFNYPGNNEVPVNGADEDCSGADEWFVSTDFALGDAIVTEVMFNPSLPEGAWFEMYNAFGHEVSLSGLVITDGNGVPFTVDTLIIPAFDSIVFGGVDAASLPTPVVPDVLLPSGFLLDSSTTLLLEMQEPGTPAVQLDQLPLGAGFPSPAADQSIQLHPTFYDASENNVGGNWCAPAAGTPGAVNADCGFGLNPARPDPTPPTSIEFDFDWTSTGTGPDVSDSTGITLTITDPNDPSGADPVSGTFLTGNSGTGQWDAWHNEQGDILVWTYDTTDVVYRGVRDASGCYSGYMRIDLDYVGTWQQTNCP